MIKGLYERLIEDVLENMHNSDVAKKNYDDICKDYNLLYKDGKFYKISTGEKL